MTIEQQGTAFSGSGHPTDQESLRFRRVSSRMSTQIYHEPNSSTSLAQEEEQSGSEPTRELRNTVFPMALKKAIRQVQQMQVPAQFNGGSWKQKRTKFMRQFKSNVREFLYFFSLWGKTLQKIGGNFGGGVQSYFIFLRFLVILNFVSFLLIAGFVLIPSIVFRSMGIKPESSKPDVSSECLKYNPNPQGLVVFYEFFLDLLSGTGFMEYSYMFYGYYNNTVIVTSLVGSNFFYNIPLAYLLTAVFYFAFCLICIIARMGKAARVAVTTGGSDVRSYSMIVFTGWDYGCLGSKATKLKQRNIYYRLQVDLEEERLRKHAASLTLCNKVTLYSLRVLMFFVAVGLIVATCFAIAHATSFSQEQSDVAGILGLVYTYLPSIVITAGNFLVPLLCDQIALLEKYPPSATVVVALLRTVILRLVSLGILLYTLWNQITCHENRDKCALCHYNHKNYQCWETSVGQEMYKLTLFDLLVSIALLVLVEFPRRMMVDHWSCKLTQWVGRQEFVVPSNVLGLVYGQTVVWTGALFCPLLPLINTVKFVILFYCKKITLFYNCRPALRTFRSTTSAFFFLAVLLFGWILALVVMIYSIAVIHPSFACGPFRSFFRMWKIVPETFSTLPEGTRDFLFFIGSQAFSIPLFALSGVFMCYFIALASIYGKSVAMLRAQLKLAGQDKQFLVKQIEKMKLLSPQHNEGEQD
ncbi:transmembrane channel-like protein 7 isoform X1 [Gambusia affinis]|uniref:transmembrane channel-like protein 7 isoform X1 n=1 Tax=Gambusia affinis TaxID=33528 RepID=UPI001CDCE2B7|nr:transmembrane channel-like protein 7 isoform X1 [Gambusia affinis]